MASWSDVIAAAPELAPAVQERFDSYGLSLMATLRADGSPRISGLEPLFSGGELWLGMMPGSRKALDLLRDPRFALHSATTDKQVTHGDAKIAGRAVPVDDESELGRFRTTFEDNSGYPVPPGAFSLFRADITEVSMVKPEDDHLNIDWWREGKEVNRVQRK